MTFTVPASAAEFLEEAQSAWKKGDALKTRFWLARHLAAADFRPDPGMDALLKEMRLEPKGFIPSSWPKNVADWFVQGGREMWNIDASRIHADTGRFEVAQSSHGDYFAVLTAVPEIQAWYRLENGVSTQRELLVGGSARPAPMLAFGRRISGALENQPTTVFHFFSVWALHHAALSFRDLDGSGKPELVVRLTWLVSNGFRQTAKIYRILDTERLELWKTLDAPTGHFLEITLDGNAQPIAAESIKEDALYPFVD